MASQAAVLAIIKLLFAGLAVAALVAFVIVPLVRRLRAGPDPSAYLPTYELPDEELDELEIPLGGAKPDRAALINMVRDDPRRAAMVVSRWLRSKR
jgi:flagellar biosynthesis/type III secretory pathway M-ring protein FliF/YscJ